jgi:hypothetical protein
LGGRDQKDVVQTCSGIKTRLSKITTEKGMGTQLKWQSACPASMRASIKNPVNK